MMSSESLLHRISQQPVENFAWGWRRTVSLDPGYLKQFHAAALHDDWHYHVLRDELIYVEFGRVVVEFSESDDLAAARSVLLVAGEAFRLPRQYRHRCKALCDTLLTLAYAPHYDPKDYVCLIPGTQFPEGRRP